jgi:sulfite reductase (ferredoxin)
MSNLIKKLDLRGVKCPLNFVRAKIALDDSEVGTVLELFIDDGEAYDSVHKSLSEEGHEIVSLSSIEDETWLLVVKKINR